MSLLDINEFLEGRVPGVLIPALSRWLGVDWLNENYDLVRDVMDEQGGDFLARCLEHISLENTATATDLDRIPRTGPVLVVANHPFGMGDSMILGDLLSRYREDTRMIGNFLLGKVPELREILIEVNPFGGDGSQRGNVAGMRDALDHLRKGGLLGMFPAGEVAHFSLSNRRVTECPWSKHVMRLAEKSGAPVVPVYIDGKNSLTFHTLGLVHPMLRTLQLIREFRKLANRKVPVLIGKPIPVRRIPNSSPEKGAAFLRRHVELLGTTSREKRWQITREGRKLSPVELEPIVPPVDPDVLETEIGALPEDRIHVTRGDWNCYFADAGEVPSVIREIGRLREKTFRTVGEGTGKSIDLDEFDEWYGHLFLWNPVTRKIGGAYRIGKSDLILAERGMSGFYCRSLFHFKREFFKRLGSPALELGRSFVVEECQKGYLSLGMLFLGIGEVFRREPRYRYAFGAVSISSNYLTVSRNLMVQFLQKHAFSGDFSQLVKPRSRSWNRETSSRTRTTLENVAEGLETIEQIDATVGSIEHDGKGIPTLLRQYMKFNATYLGFNVDAKFSGVLDGLMIVDLTTISPRIGKRFLGEGVVEAVREFHEMETAAL